MRNKKQLIWQLPFLAFLIIGTVLIIRQQQKLPYVSIQGNIFGTIYHITYQSDKDLQHDIEQALAEVDQSLSPFNPQSIITKVNNNEDVVVDDIFVEVFNLAQKISQDTDGAFDITVAPLVNHWGFGFKTTNSPDMHAIDSLISFVGYQKVTLGKDRRIRKNDSRLMLDCSAIAKGYGSDIVAKVLESHDVNNYMIEIGGEIVTKGISEKRSPWRIGINRPTEDPTNMNNEIEAILQITDLSMATSGNYRNFYYKDGKKYAHTIDPHTGLPVEHSLLSATVVAQRCAIADAYATAFMVLGLEKSKAILQRHSELMAYLIFADHEGKYQIWCSPKLREKIIEN
jgi:thiamine biosynthesis lipoprotein